MFKNNVKTAVVNDKTFYITPFSAFAALPILGDLQKQILPALGALIKENDGDDIDYQAAAQSIAVALGGDSLMAWSKRLINEDTVSVELDGDAKKLTQLMANQVFADPFEIIEVMIEVILVNFKDPLMRSLSRFGLGDKAAAKFSQLASSDQT